MLKTFINFKIYQWSFKAPLKFPNVLFLIQRSSCLKYGKSILYRYWLIFVFFSRPQKCVFGSFIL